MKKNIVCLLLLLSIEATAQKDSSAMNILELPDSTALGEPDGKAVSKEIGPAGGTIISEDGRVKLIFPAGALTEIKTIVIQPTTNNGPNGTGKAYQFEPSGIQFNKPVQVIFHYTEEEANTCPADLMAFGLQDHTGKWSFMDYDNWDSVGMMLRGNILHFSWFTNLAKMKLAPRFQEIRVGDSLDMYIVAIKQDSKRVAVVQKEKPILWYVNDVINGQGTRYGWIESQPLLFDKNHNVPAALYVAPKRLPDKTPVIVRADVLIRSGKAFMVQKSFTSKIELYDEYKILLTDTIETRAAQGTFVADSASFIARITTKDIQVSDVRNYSPYSFIRHASPLFKIKILITGDCKGPMHIGESRNSGELVSFSQKMFTKNSMLDEVLLVFDPHDILAFRYSVSGRGIKITNQDMTMESVPDIVSFHADGESQIYRMAKSPVSAYTIYVTPFGQATRVYPGKF
jgi:hypothetical protein